MTLILDVTSLMLRRRQSVMTGIDRVEYALASWLCSEGAQQYPDAVFLLNTRSASGIMTPDRMRHALAKMEMQRGIAAGPGAIFRSLLEHLSSAPQPNGRVGAVRITDIAEGRWRWVDQIAVAWRAILGAHAFKKLLKLKGASLRYVHASHYGLQWRERHDWISRYGVKATFFVHDLIPIDFPQYCSLGAHHSHRRKLQTIAGLAGRIAVNSNYTADRLTAFLQAEGLSVPPIEVHRLGTGALSLQSTSGAGSDRRFDVDADLKGTHPFFLCAGTIEGRKNVAVLLEAWRLLAQKLPANEMPRLVLAGTRGWSNDALLKELDEMTDIAPYVIEVNGLNDRELMLVMERAQAVLKPSFVEGYSLVPAEALARGVPVIASDIPAHRELPERGRRLIKFDQPEAWLEPLLSSYNRIDVDFHFDWRQFSRDLLSVYRF